MKDLRIKIESKTRKVFPDGDILGISMENLQGSIICYFDEFVDGTAWLEIQMPDRTKGYLAMEKAGETYVLPIKSSLLKQAGLINMQLRITQGENIEEMPVFKSNMFFTKVKEAINATSEIPDEYPEWIDIANMKLTEIDNLDISAEKIEKTATITITRKDGSEEVVEIYDGDDYILTNEDKEEIVDTVKPMVEETIKPTLDNNLQEAKSYADDIKPTKTSELINDSNFAKTNHNNNFSAGQTINGTLTINGNIVQNGEQYETHAEKVFTKNDEIITRDGAVGGLSDGEYAGIQALLYDGENNGRLGFNADGEAKVGDVGDEQPLLTRDEIVNLEDGQVFVWEANKLRAVGSSDFVKNTDFANISKAGVSKMWTSTNEDEEIGLNISTEV